MNTILHIGSQQADGEKIGVVFIYKHPLHLLHLLQARLLEEAELLGLCQSCRNVFRRACLLEDDIPPPSAHRALLRALRYPLSGG